MEISHMPKSRAVVLIRGAFGTVTEAGCYANSYKAASKIANELRSGTFRDEGVQAEYNENADKFAFDWQEATASDDEIVNEIAAADALAEEVAKSEKIMSTLEAQGTHSYANNYGGSIHSLRTGGKTVG